MNTFSPKNAKFHVFLAEKYPLVCTGKINIKEASLEKSWKIPQRKLSCLLFLVSCRPNKKRQPWTLHVDTTLLSGEEKERHNSSP